MKCQASQSSYYSYMEGDFDAIPAETLGHLETCSTCQEGIAHLRQALDVPFSASAPRSDQVLALHFCLLDRWVDCDSVRSLLPLSAIASLPILVQTPVTAHLAACSACRRDLQKLKALRLSDGDLLSASRWLAEDAVAAGQLPSQVTAVLSAMRRRAGSGIATCAGFSPNDESGTLQVRTRIVRPVHAASRFGTRLRRAAAGITAAAVLLAVLVMVVQPKRADALELRRIYETITQVQHLSIVTTIPEEETPLQRIWASQTLGLRLFESGGEMTLYDLNTRGAWVRQGAEPAVPAQRTVFSPPVFLQPPWGLLPFRDIRQLPEGMEWKRLDTLSDEQWVVYELSWMETLQSGRILQKKWLGTLDRDTLLPVRIQWFQRFEDRRTDTLQMTMEVTYLSEQKFMDAVNARGFDVPYGDQINMELGWPVPEVFAANCAASMD